MLTQLARNWWVLALRGVAAILFGVLAFIWPSLTVAALVILFGAYALVDGVFAIVGAVQHRHEHDRWWVLLLEGIAGLMRTVHPGSRGYREAATLLAGASAIRERFSCPLTSDDQREQGRLVEELRRTLGEEAFENARAEGAAMTWEQASTEALRMLAE